MPRNINYTITMYGDDEHKTIIFIRKFRDAESVCRSFVGLNKSFLYNVFKKKPKKIGRVTMEKLSRLEIMRCETNKEGENIFSFWNKKNGIEEFSDSENEDSA